MQEDKTARGAVQPTRTLTSTKKEVEVMVSSQRIKVPGLLSAGVLVAALAAAGGLSTLRGSDGTPPSPPIAEAREYIHPAAQRPTQVFYVVENDEQEAMILRAENELQTAAVNEGRSPASRNFSIYKVTSPEEAVAVDLSIGASMMELGEGGTTDAQVVDFRNR
jgi:hypothetical protein